MHKNWVRKEYDQCVTCLAEDRETQGLVVARFTLQEFYQKQTIAYKSNKQRCMGKTQIRDIDQKVQLKNSGLQKESNQTEQRNSNGERNKIRLLI